VNDVIISANINAIAIHVAIYVAIYIAINIAIYVAIYVAIAITTTKQLIHPIHPLFPPLPRPKHLPLPLLHLQIKLPTLLIYHSSHLHIHHVVNIWLGILPFL